jgi:hypothetical protein
MLTWIANIYYVVIAIPGTLWRTIRKLAAKWWNSHY